MGFFIPLLFILIPVGKRIIRDRDFLWKSSIWIWRSFCSPSPDGWLPLGHITHTITNSSQEEVSWRQRHTQTFVQNGLEKRSPEEIPARPAHHGIPELRDRLSKMAVHQWIIAGHGILDGPWRPQSGSGRGDRKGRASFSPRGGSGSVWRSLQGKKKLKRNWLKVIQNAENLVTKWRLFPCDVSGFLPV